VLCSDDDDVVGQCDCVHAGGGGDLVVVRGGIVCAKWGDGKGIVVHFLLVCVAVVGVRGNIGCVGRVLRVMRVTEGESGMKKAKAKEMGPVGVVRVCGGCSSVAHCWIDGAHQAYVALQ
jgi:hypothetical protein